jgi:hypothetical protein
MPSDIDSFRKHFVTKSEFNEVVNQMNDFKTKFAEINKKLDSILKIQDYILNEVPELGTLDKPKMLKCSPPLKSSDIVGKFLGNNTRGNGMMASNSGSFAVPNTSIHKLLSQSQSAQNDQLLNQLRSISGGLKP